MREGRSTVTELASLIAKSDVVLMLAATDVTLLELTIPPMPEAKLKLALPILVEDRLLIDPADGVFVLVAKAVGNNVDQPSVRSIAVAQRSWLQQLASSLFALGANHIKAVPAQLCLPLKSAQLVRQISVRLAESEQDSYANMALRFDLDRGVGLLLDADTDVALRLSTMLAMVAKNDSTEIALYLPTELVAAYKSAIAAEPLWSERISVHNSTWQSSIQAARSLNVNLMAGLNNAQTNRIQWKTWRWPLVLATALLLVNVIALNNDYWNLLREARALKQNMLQTYKVSFPKDTVVVFPLEQMKKNLDLAERNSGQASTNDFTLLLSLFGSAWESVGSTKLPKLVSIEFKDHGLVLQIKGTMPQQELEQALSAKGLTLKKNNAEVWQVRSVK